jgi:TFIIF-interacting CTD phosphatase-like protein
MQLMTFLSLLTPSTSAELERKSVSFGEPTRHKTLILDLDETLITSRPLIKGIPADFFETEDNFIIEVGDSKMPFEVTVRPHVMKVIEELSHMYEIAVFTAAECDYATAIL